MDEPLIEVKTKIKVQYVCDGCDNTVTPPPQQHYGCSTQAGYNIIDRNLIIVCCNCGCVMEPKVVKTKFETTECIEMTNLLK